MRRSHFISKRTGRSSKRMANERAWNEQNHFDSLISFVKGRRGRGRKFTSFVSNYPRLSFLVSPPCSRFCYLSVPAIQLLQVFADMTSFPLSHGDLQYFSAGLNCPIWFSNCGDYNDPFWTLSRATLSLEKKYIHFSCYC